MMDTLELLALLGYEATPLQIHAEGVDPKERLHEVLAELRSEIGSDRSALLWNAFTMCEWDVVCGFDVDKNQLFGRGSYIGLDGGQYASAVEDRVLTAEARMHYEAVLVGERTGTFDAHEAELAALKEAVRHARSTQNEDKCGGDQWVMLEGLLCYDRWVGDFRSNPSKVPELGDTYCLSVYSSTHQTAGQFLRELAPRYSKADANLKRGAEHFASEAKALKECYEVMCPGGKAPEEANPERNERIAELLNQAREQYAHGIEEIESALQLMG